MRGPGRSTPRRPLTGDDVHALLLTATARLLEAEPNHVGTPAGDRRRHRAELDLLLLRLAADTGARRGELAALRVDDLQGRVLRIERAVSAETLTTPKSGHGRVLTVGAGTAALWEQLTGRWRQELAEPLGPWLFSRDLSHHLRLGATTLGHRFALRRLAAGMHDATLHRLRHNVATFLMARGEILQARARLGHADAATTLREYAYALPLTDAPVADALEQHLLQLAEPDLPCDDGKAHQATDTRRR
jgi:integrase